MLLYRFCHGDVLACPERIAEELRKTVEGRARRRRAEERARAYQTKKGAEGVSEVEVAATGTPGIGPTTCI